MYLVSADYVFGYKFLYLNIHIEKLDIEKKQLHIELSKIFSYDLGLKHNHHINLRRIYASSHARANVLASHSLRTRIKLKVRPHSQKLLQVGNQTGRNWWP